MIFPGTVYNSDRKLLIITFGKIIITIYIVYSLLFPVV